MKRAWTQELRVVLPPLLCGLALGVVFDASGLGLLGGLLWYLGYHLRQAHRLAVWLERERSVYPPEAEGLWGEVFHRLYHRQRAHRQRKRELSRLLLRFQQSTRAIPDALVVVDAQHCIQWTNSAATHLLGVSAAADQGQRIENLLRHPSFQAFLTTATPGEPLTLRSPIDQRTLLELRWVAFAEGQQLIIVRDATERQRMDQMRRDFVANVSHELRTPLTVLSGYLENMQRDPEVLPPRWHRPVQSMAEQAERMRRLVEDLLLLARVESTPPAAADQRSVVDVPALLRALRNDALELSAGDGHRVVLDCDAQLRLSGVESELLAVFTNLVANAVQYTPAGGEVRMRWYARDGGAFFEVADDGEGIPPEYISRLTERFYRVDKGRSRDRGGTGLGLSIVKHVLERHGASLQVQSTVGEGSLFRCVFPANLVVHGRVLPRVVGA